MALCMYCIKIRWAQWDETLAQHDAPDDCQYGACWVWPGIASVLTAVKHAFLNAGNMVILLPNRVCQGALLH
jgi:hypothetical protein